MIEQDSQDLINMIDASANEKDSGNVTQSETKEIIKPNKVKKPRRQKAKKQTNIKPEVKAELSEIKQDKVEVIKIAEKTKIAAPSYINPRTDLDLITMNVLHSPHVMDKKSQINKLKELHPSLNILNINYLGRTLNEVKNTKFKLIADTANKSFKEYILYIDQTLGLFKPLKLNKIPNDLDIAYLLSPNNNILSDIILVKTSVIKNGDWNYNQFMTSKMNLTNLINNAKEKGYKVDTLNKYLF